MLQIIDAPPLQDRVPFIRHSQMHGCRWFSSIRIQSTCSHGIDPPLFQLNHIITKEVTHWGRDKMHIFQTAFSNGFPWKKLCEIWVRISLKFVPMGTINNIPALVQIMTCGDLAPGHYLNQWWLTYICVTRSQWVNASGHFHKECHLDYQYCTIIAISTFIWMARNFRYKENQMPTKPLLQYSRGVAAQQLLKGNP